MAPALKLLDILGVLVRHGVGFIVVGGVAATLEGAPVTTLDLDILPDRAALPILRRTLAKKTDG